MGKRFREVVALGEVAIQLGQDDRLLFGLCPLGHDLHAEGVGELGPPIVLCGVLDGLPGGAQGAKGGDEGTVPTAQNEHVRVRPV